MAVHVYRSQADATAKIIRVEDGRALGVVEVTSVAGSQAQKAAGRDALKEAGKQLSKKIQKELGKIME